MGELKIVKGRKQGKRAQLALDFFDKITNAEDGDKFTIYTLDKQINLKIEVINK